MVFVFFHLALHWLAEVADGCEVWGGRGTEHGPLGQEKQVSAGCTGGESETSVPSWLISFPTWRVRYNPHSPWDKVGEREQIMVA